MQQHIRDTLELEPEPGDSPNEPTRDILTLGTTDVSGTGAVEELPTNNLDNFVQGAKSVSEIITHASNVINCHELFEKRMAAIEAGRAQEHARVKASVGKLGSLDQGQRRVVIQEEMAAFRKEQMKTSHENRYADLAKMKTNHDMVTMVESLYSSPSRLLMQHGFGTEQRSRYLYQMEHAGPIELQLYAALAVSRGDKVLVQAQECRECVVA